MCYLNIKIIVNNLKNGRNGVTPSDRIHIEISNNPA